MYSLRNWAGGTGLEGHRGTSPTESEEKHLVDRDPLLTGKQKEQDPALWWTMVLSGGDQREHTRGHHF